MKWVRPGGTASADGDAMSSIGGFATTLTVSPTYVDATGRTVDCTVIQCYLMTFAAHGDPDTSQDTAVALSFAGQAAASEAPPAAPLPELPGASSPSGSAPSRTATIALASLRLSRAGRLTLRVTGPGTITIDVRRKVAKRKPDGRLVVRWKQAKTIRVKATAAGTITRRLGLRRAGRYRVAVSARGLDGKVTRARARVLTVKARR